MKKFLATIIVVIIAASCTPKSSTETTAAADSLVVEPETPPAEEGSYDTTWVSTELPLKSSFNSPQYSKTIAYVYRKVGLQLYRNESDCGDTTKAIGLLNYGDRIELTDDLVKSRCIGVKMKDGATNYVFSEYLSNMPLPKFKEQSFTNLSEYFLRSFQLAKPPVKRTPHDTTEEAKYSFQNLYNFESDIRVNHHGYYEGGGTTVVLPENATMQDAWLLMHAFPDFVNFQKGFPKFPTDAGETVITEGLTAIVTKSEDGRLTKISLEDTTGCFDEFSIVEEGGRVKIVIDGGC
jgi:hypothetical protein